MQQGTGQIRSGIFPHSSNSIFPIDRAFLHERIIHVVGSAGKNVDGNPDMSEYMGILPDPIDEPSRIVHLDDEDINIAPGTACR
ncbi:MAG TPA: hypothetical protein PLA74_07675 [Syntrophales bacterium]|jgi:hypothetical protein|nr:hypothetical protein [Syntrophales bacterium]